MIKRHATFIFYTTLALLFTNAFAVVSTQSKSLAPDYLLQIGECQEPNPNSLIQSLLLHASENCQAKRALTQIDLAIFKEILFGSQGLYSELQNTDEYEWLWKDAQFLFSKASQSQRKIQSLSRLIAVLDELNLKYPYSSQGLQKAINSQNWYQCGSQIQSTIIWQEENWSIKRDSFYIDSDLQGVNGLVTWSPTHRFSNRKEFQFDGYTIKDTLGFEEIKQDSLVLWAVDSCGLAHGYKFELNWPWQPRFYRIKTLDKNLNGQIDALSLHSIDLIDSLIHWKNLTLHSDGIPQKLTQWTIQDSNQSVIIVSLPKELSIHQRAAELLLELKSSFGTRKHQVEDGVGPVLNDVGLIQDTLSVSFNESVYWSNQSRIYLKDEEIKPLSWTSINPSQWKLTLPKDFLHLGDSISVGQSVKDLKSNPAIANLALVQGQLEESDRILGSVSVKANHQLKKKLQSKAFERISSSKIIGADGIPIKVNLPANTTPTYWKIQLDIYDQSSQSLVNEVFLLNCEDLFEMSKCKEGFYENFDIYIPWNGVSSDFRQIGTGIYIIQLRVVDSMGLAVDSRSKTGIQVIK